MNKKEMLVLAAKSIEKELHLLKKEGVIQEKGYIDRLGNELVNALRSRGEGKV